MCDLWFIYGIHKKKWFKSLQRNYPLSYFWLGASRFPTWSISLLLLELLLWCKYLLSSRWVCVLSSQNAAVFWLYIWETCSILLAFNAIHLSIYKSYIARRINKSRYRNRFCDWKKWLWNLKEKKELESN